MKKLLILFLLICNATLVYSQTKVADLFFKEYAYYKASELYLEAAKKGDSSMHVLTRLGDCYYNNTNIASASFWYGKALEKYPKVNSEYIYKYIQTQRSLNDYAAAEKWIKIVKEKRKNDKRFKDKDILNIRKFESLKATDHVYITLENLEINTAYSDFGAFEKDGVLYFSSTRTKDSITDKKKLYKWNEEPYLSIYKSKILNKILKAPRKLRSSALNSEFHESSLVITNDGKTLYFTRINLNKREQLKYDKGGTSNLKIYRAKREGNIWTKLEELPFNGNNFSTGSPALSPDNNTLFFSSDREGGYGQTDLYKVEINLDGTFGTPENLGDLINTEGRENFPFVAKDSTFYFSSDAHLNLGLYDIFETNILKEDQNSIEIKNLGAPYNSGYDDFAFFIDSDTQTGYLSSNRLNGKGGDDIYAFREKECKQILNGIIKDEITLKPLSKVQLKLVNESGIVIKKGTTNKEGFYEFLDLSCEKKYTIIANKPDYRSHLKVFKTSNINDEKTIIDFLLTPLIIDNEIVINPIFFDFNKSNIRPDAAYELENIVAVMRTHNTMIIKIEAHTDSRGRDNFNKKLSNRRAISTRDYLFYRGISTERIVSAIGFGESQLINRCKNKVKCSESEHQENRRSKFIILSD